jgi:hypothetical protein
MRQLPFSLRPLAALTIAGSLAASIAAGGCGRRPAEPAAAKRTSSKAYVSERFPPLLMDVKPITDPKLVPSTKTKLDDEQIVIGIEIDGEARAYLREAFCDPQKHVVRDTVGGIPIAVTYCDRQRCTRVFTPEDPSLPLDIHVGGWRTDDTMELLVNGNGYSQKAQDIPLKSLPFVEITWGQWRRQHPDSRIYLGEQLLN